MDLPHTLAVVFACLALMGAVQSLLGWRAMARLRGDAGAAPRGTLPAVSVLKPLHGAESLLEEALASFFAQDYPRFQLVFGVQSGNDLALPVVERLRARFPGVDVAVVVDPAWHGRNHKIGNLINMLPEARHGVLVIADSDMHVAPDYLRRVAGALARPGTGLVTTIYGGRPDRPTLANRLGVAAITQIFAPGVLLARGLGRQDCMGATMALTRETLERCGGLAALAPYIADDAVLGRRVRALGLDVALAPTVPATTVAEPDLRALIRHELRWARTIRGLAPVGYALSVLQLPVALALLAAAADPAATLGWAAVALAWAARGLAARGIERAMGAPLSPVWLVPLRDLLSAAIMLAAYAGREVAWRGRVIDMRGEARMAPARAPRLVPEEGVGTR